MASPSPRATGSRRSCFEVTAAEPLTVHGGMQLATILQLISIARSKASARSKLRMLVFVVLQMQRSAWAFRATFCQ